MEPIPRALEYYKKCLLPDGKIARYYEFRTNKPLYMDANYQLTYDDSAAPSHYGWKQNARFDAIEKEYQDAVSGIKTAPLRSARALEGDVRTIIQQLDEEGRWISTYAGPPWIPLLWLLRREALRLDAHRSCQERQKE